jgi:hypothetical protein
MPSTKDTKLEPTRHPVKRVLAVDVAEACRSAALAFMNEAPLWTKATFTLWRTGPYAAVSDRVQATATWQPLPLYDSIDSRMVTRLLRSAYSEVRRALSYATHGPGLPIFASAMYEGRFVTDHVDVEGTTGYAPTLAARRLPDVVLALFAADCLFRTGDYVDALTFCGRCQVLTFDRDTRMRGHCSRHVGMFASARLPSSFPRLREGA